MVRFSFFVPRYHPTWTEVQVHGSNRDSSRNLQVLSRRMGKKSHNSLTNWEWGGGKVDLPISLCSLPPQSPGHPTAVVEAKAPMATARAPRCLKCEESAPFSPIRGVILIGSGKQTPFLCPQFTLDIGTVTGGGQQSRISKAWL